MPINAAGGFHVGMERQEGGAVREVRMLPKGGCREAHTREPELRWGGGLPPYFTAGSRPLVAGAVPRRFKNDLRFVILSRTEDFSVFFSAQCSATNNSWDMTSAEEPYDNIAARVCGAL